MASQSFYNFLCLAGIALSVYSLWVEYNIEADPNYKPACHIKIDNLFEANCATAFTSDYGKGVFGFIDGSRVDVFKGDIFLRKKFGKKIWNFFNKKIFSLKNIPSLP